METRNEYLLIKPVKKGIMSVEGNEYEVLIAPVDEIGDQQYQAGDIVIVEDIYLVRVIVESQETFFVKESNVLARIPKDGCKTDCQCHTQE